MDNLIVDLLLFTSKIRHGSESSGIGLHFGCDAEGGGCAINFVAE